MGPSGCAATAYCTGETIDGDAGICCDLFGSTAYADNQLGSDQDCCGTKARPCRSLSQVISLILNLGQPGVTIVATVDGGAGDWSGNEGRVGDEGNVNLTLGMILHAPGVRFPATSVKQFRVRSSGAFDPGPVAIEGDEASSAYVDIEGPIDDNDPVSGVPLALSWARLDAILSLGPKADVVAKPAASGAPSVILAAPELAYGGLFCRGSVAGQAKFSGTISVSNFATDVTVGDDCTASFTGSQIGPAVQDGGCPSQDPTGILTIGNGSIALLPGTAVSCAILDGVQLASGTSPTFTAQGASISNCGSAGLRVSGGTATISGSTITGNAYGVVQETGGSFAVDATGAESTIACNTEVGLWNDSATSAAASHTRWNRKTPAVLTCSDQFITCSCSTAGGCGAAPYSGVDVAITPDQAGASGTVDVSSPDPTPALCN